MTATSQSVLARQGRILREELLEDQQQPQYRGMIAAVRYVLVDQTVDEGHLEEAAVGKRGALSDPAGLRQQWAAEPGGQGDRETHFLPVEVFMRNVSFERFFQQPLAAGTPEFHIGRQVDRPFDELVVQKRRADLKRVCHARPVGFHQDVAPTGTS